MQQAIKPNCDIVTYSELELNPDCFLIFLKEDNSIIGFIYKNDEEEFVVQTSSSWDDSLEFESISDIIDYYSKLGHEVTIWYEKVENRA